MAPTARFEQAVRALRWMQPTQAQLVVRMHSTLADVTGEDAIEQRVESLVGAMDSASQVAAKAAAEKQAMKDAREAAKRARTMIAAESAHPDVPPRAGEDPEHQ